jgi:predicted DNA-binding transcriptional regulator AlpA
MSPDVVNGIDMADLARRVAALTDPEALLDADDVAAWLKCTARYVKEHYAKSGDFPQPMRLPAAEGRRGQPRWRRQDIQDWLDQHRPRARGKPGRKRLN